MLKSEPHTRIEVESAGECVFRVRVIDGQGESVHRVTADNRQVQRFTDGKASAEALLKRSFEFLLERESKESILREFNISVISRYFPEYEQEIKKML